MEISKNRKRVLGAIVLLASIAGVAWGVWRVKLPAQAASSSPLRSSQAQVTSSLWQWANPQRNCWLEGPAVQWLAGNEPIFARTGEGWVMVGAVDRKLVPPPPPPPGSLAPQPLLFDSVQDPQGRLRVRWFDPRWMPRAQTPWHLHFPDGTLASVARRLLPASKLKRWTDELQLRFEKDPIDWSRTVEPLLMATVRELLPAIQLRLGQSLREQLPQMEELAMRYQVELLERKVLPLVRSELLPAARERLSPLAAIIGEELFERASIWNFALGYLYDASPLPERNLVRREFERFVEEDATPVLTTHLPEILEALQALSIDLAQRPAVRDLAREALGQWMVDPQLRSILGKVLTDVVNDASAFREIIDRHWQSEAGAALSAQIERVVEPWMRDMGADLFGSPEKGLTPEVVAMLRQQILMKDRRWLVVEVVPVDSILQGDLQDSYPLIYRPSVAMYPWIEQESEPTISAASLP
jgi:hypothetical protein